MGKIKTILHLSDIHIRKLHRFVEYREVFNRLYKQAKQLKPDLIYVGGDIVHGKLDTSPEETRMVANFFLQLSQISTTIIIPGNHDCNLNNKSREDTLSPIIDLVKKINPNIHYFKQSGVYTLDNIDFGVLSIFDVDKDGNQSVNTLPDPSTMNNTKIGLFHGAVGTFQYDNGFQVTDKNVHVSTFKGYDMVLLGDIHKRQFLNKEKTIGYCGSLIQQGFTEEPAHGFLLWDVETKSAEFHAVENDYGFKVITVDDGKIQNKMKFIPPKGKIKIKYWNTTLEQIKDIQIDLRKKYPKIREIIAEKQDVLSKIDGTSSKINVGDVRDVEYQNELIVDYLANNIEGVDADTIKRICELNKLTNNSPEIYDGGITRNVDWKLKSFEFDNMFSYGPGSKIDFTKLDGVVGVVAPNHSGKSAMMDAIAYTIFDICSRTNKALDVMNKRKSTFKAKLNLEINGEDYWIERVGTQKVRHHRDGTITESCPVAVKFYMIDGDDKIDLSGAARFNSQYGSGTNEEIKKVLGTFDDFILTSLSLQNNGTDFMDKKQAERKQILSQFMDIDIFEQLESIARSDSNEERALLKTFRKKDSYKDLSAIEQYILDYEEVETDLTKKIQNLDDEIDSLEDIKFKFGIKLHKVDSTILHIDKLDVEKNTKELKKKTIENLLIDDREYKENLRPLFNEYNDKINKFDETEIKTNYELFNKLTHELKDISSNIQIIESTAKSLNKHADDLDKYKYDPDCKFCINNGEEQINEKTSIQQQLNELGSGYKTIISKQEKTLTSFDQVKDAEADLHEFDRFSDELNQIRHDAVKVAGKITAQESEIKQLDAELLNVDTKITQYYDNEQKIKDNEITTNQINQCINDITELNNKKKSLNRQYNDNMSKLNMYRSEKHTIERDIKKLVETEQMILDYDLYLMALSKDGVPYELISETIPAIEREVNRVLENMMAGFTIKMTMEGKNIETMICYDGSCWNLELASGMEKFVSSLAIRIGLINISTLPRPNFLVIDEGFGTLDGDNIANMEGAFQYLKTQFDFVLIVSHLDTIKDYMDMLIPIEITNKYSKITLT